MIIGTCGFGSSGSSVISDYLQEFSDSFCILDGVEFTWVSRTDGLADLAYHVMNPHSRTSESDMAIRRYLLAMENTIGYYQSDGGLPPKTFRNSVNSFIDEITDAKWMGFSHGKMNYFEKKFKVSLLERRVIPYLERKKGTRISCYPMVEKRLSINPENFYELAKKHVRELLIGLGADFSKPIVLDQPFAGNNPQACFPFFDDPLAIVVDRDPRDMYCFANTRLVGKNYFMPTTPVEEFVRYYKALRHKQPYKNGDERVLLINFEEMVYDYDNATAKLRSFLKLPENPAVKTVFDPALSINNTQVWKRFPRFEKDVAYIEKELPEYLFDFEKYGEHEITGDMFMGKSPLNRRAKKWMGQMKIKS